MLRSSQPGDETDWVARVQRGDREAFTPLVERHERRVRSLVYHLVRRRDEVEDITQEIFIKAFKNIRSYNGESSFGTWLGRIAVNHCYDYLRREQKARVSYHWQMAEEAGRRMEENLEQHQPLSVEEEIALRDLAAKLLERAPADDRVILSLKELEDRSIEEIAELLDLRVNTVKVRLHRARKRMLEDLKRWRQGR
ncbi:MAG TPA: sigma-70 family RNA polymerase sigma factor [Terriglobia bacterium]|nr:sigma-70 family RNA polymerase sigma factor [Terriglobia bacterium]